jgi:hypothetical protein
MNNKRKMKKKKEKKKSYHPTLRLLITRGEVNFIVHESAFLHQE